MKQLQKSLWNSASASDPGDRTPSNKDQSSQSRHRPNYNHFVPKQIEPVLCPQTLMHPSSLQELRVFLLPCPCTSLTWREQSEGGQDKCSGCLHDCSSTAKIPFSPLKPCFITGIPKQWLKLLEENTCTKKQGGKRQQRRLKEDGASMRAAGGGQRKGQGPYS